MESVRALFKFQPPYKVLRLHQQSILQRVGWGATLKLLWRHWDHVIRPVLWFRTALEINGQGSFKETKCDDTGVRGGLCGSTWCRSQPATGLYMWFVLQHNGFDVCFWCIFLLRLLNFVFIDVSSDSLLGTWLKPIWQCHSQMLAFLDQMPRALDGWTLGCSANLLWSSVRLERDRQMTIFMSQQAGPFKDTRVVPKPPWCCLGLLGSTSCWKANLQPCWRLWGPNQIFIKHFTPFRSENLISQRPKHYLTVLQGLWI